MYIRDETGKKHLYSELNGDSKKYNLLYDFFSEGLLAVENKSMLNRITFIDKTGREVIKTDYYKTNNYGKDFLYRFLGGVAKVYSKATGKHYLIDKSGETL